MFDRKALLVLALVPLALIATAMAGEYTGEPWFPLKDEATLKQLFVDNSNLKDPFSAQFRKVEVRAFQKKDGKTLTTWCGEVNAKNSMGAYEGWKPFYATENLTPNPSIMVVSFPGDSTEMLLKIMCKGTQFAS